MVQMGKSMVEERSDVNELDEWGREAQKGSKAWKDRDQENIEKHSSQWFWLRLLALSDRDSSELDTGACQEMK